MTSTPGSTSPYSSAAREKFDALLSLYSRNDTFPKDDRTSFWKLGNSFDSMIDFLDVIDHTGADDLAAVVVKQFAYSLSDLGGYDNAWFDDFGWWSVSTQRAVGKPFFDADSKQALSKITGDCWTRFTGNAPYVWERRQPGSYPDCHPVFDGGVWNEYWKGTSSSYPGPKGADPESGSLEGIQNTVTNALYLMAAHRIGHTDPVARQAAQKELEFLLKWFDDQHHALWWAVSPDAGLVRERVGHFAKHSVSIPPAPGFQANWAWTGDQGLILGDLSDAILHIAPGLRGPLLARATKLITGVCQHLTDGGVLRSFTDSGQVPSGDYSDYETGVGVFWRNALYVWQTNSELRSALSTPAFQKTLRASADAAANAPTRGALIDALTNQTAALVAASVMLLQ